MQQQIHTASAVAAPTLHSSNGAVRSLCWGRRLFLRFWGAPCMQSTLAWAPLPANSLQLVVKALLRGTRTEHACTSIHHSNTRHLSPACSGAPAIICLDKEGAYSSPGPCKGLVACLSPLFLKDLSRICPASATAAVNTEKRS